jgi:hypothetical protein
VNQAMSWSEVAAGICAGYIFLMKRKRRPKYAKRFWKRRLFNQVGFFGEGPGFLDATAFNAVSETDL